jgi:hypothetical protein
MLGCLTARRAIPSGLSASRGRGRSWQDVVSIRNQIVESALRCRYADGLSLGAGPALGRRDSSGNAGRGIIPGRLGPDSRNDHLRSPRPRSQGSRLQAQNSRSLSLCFFGARQDLARILLAGSSIGQDATSSLRNPPSLHALAARVNVQPSRSLSPMPRLAQTVGGLGASPRSVRSSRIQIMPLAHRANVVGLRPSRGGPRDARPVARSLGSDWRSRPF